MRKSKIIIITLEVATKNSDLISERLMRDLHAKYNPFYRAKVTSVDIFPKPIDLTDDRPKAHICDEGARPVVVSGEEG